MSNLEILISTCIEIGTTNAFVRMGMASGEISQRKAEDAARAELYI